MLVANGPLGKTKYCAIRVEFQVRGSPHTHSFIWIENAPKLTVGKIDNYILWVDSIISAKLPDIDNDPQLHDLSKRHIKYIGIPKPVGNIEMINVDFTLEDISLIGL